MATNVLGSAYIKISPQLVGFDKIADQIANQVRGAVREALRLGDELDKAGQAARRVAKDAEGVGDATRQASKEVDTLTDGFDEASAAARRAVTESVNLQTGITDAGTAATTTAGATDEIGAAAMRTVGSAGAMSDAFGAASAAAANTASNVDGIGTAAANAVSHADTLSTSLEAATAGVGEAAAGAEAGWEEAFAGVEESGSGAFSLLTGAAAAFGFGLEDAISDASRDAAEESGDAAEEAQSRWGRALSGIKENAGSLFAAAGVAAAAAFTVGLQGTIEQQSRDILLQASLGVDPAEATRLGGIAGDLYVKAYGDSLGEVTAAVGTVRHSIQGMAEASSTDLGTVAGRALSIASAFGEDVVPTITTASQLIRSGLAPDMDSALDLIATGFQKGANYGGDFLDVLTSRAPNLKQFGFDGAAAVGFLVQGMQAGADSAGTVAGALDELIGNAGSSADLFAELGFNGEKMARDLSGGGPKAAQALDALLEKLRAIKDPAQRATAFASLFGEEAAVFQSAILSLDPSNAVNALGQVEGAAASLDATMGSGTQSALTTIQRTFEAGFANLASVALPPIEKLVTGIAGKVGPAFSTAEVGTRAFFTAIREGGGTSDGFVGFMERAGNVVRDLGGAAVAVWPLILPGLRDLGRLVTDSVWPALRNLWEIAKGLWPDVQAIGKLVGAVLLVAFRALATVLADVIGPALREITGFWRSNQTTITALAVAVGVGVAAWKAYQLAVSAVTTAQWIWQTRTLIMEVVMRNVRTAMAAMRTATLAMNSAFLANPIAIIIVALIALAAGIAYAWTHSEKFREVVTGAWNAVKDATMTALGAVRDFFVAVWNGMWGVVGPVVGAIVSFVTGAWNVISAVTSAVWGVIKVFFEVWWTVVSTVFTTYLNVIKTVLSVAWTVISAVITAAWNVIKFFFQTWWAIVSAIFNVALGVIKAVLAAAWSVISTVINVVWGAIQAYFRLWWTVLSTIFGTALGILKTVIGGAWDAIRTVTSTVWGAIQTIFSTALGAIRTTTDTIMGGVRTAFDTALGAIKTAFQVTKDGIKTIWDGLKAVASAPVKFVVETVYNNGIRKAWNAIVAKIPGVPEMGALNVPGLAAGGPITGGVRGRDSVLRWLMPGEHVLTADEVANAGGHGRIFALRAALGGGTQAAGPGMALGGVGSALGAAWDATGGRVVDKFEDLARAGLAKGFELAVSPLRGLMNSTLGRGDNWKGIINRLIQSPFDKLIDWVRGKEAEVAPVGGPVGSAPVGEIQTYAKALLDARGWASQWGSFNALVMGESGWNPMARNPSSGAFGIPQALPASKLDAYGNRNDYHVQLRWMLDYIGQRYGNPASAYSTWQRRSPHWYDQGGPLHPGWTMAYNGTGHDEWVSVHKPGGGGGGATLTLNVDARQASDPAAVERAVQQAGIDLLAGLNQMLTQGEGVL